MKSYIEAGMNDYGVGELLPDYVETETLIAPDHIFLFDFVNYDISGTELLFNEYLSCLDDGGGADTDLLLQVISGIQKSHPYFRAYPSNSSRILNRIMAGYITMRFGEKSIEERTALFEKACTKRYAPYADAAYNFENPIIPDKGHPLSTLKNLQKRLKRWLFIVLDDTNPELREYSTERRSMLYNYFYGDNNTITIKTEIRPTISRRMNRASIQYVFDDIKDYEAYEADKAYKEDKAFEVRSLEDLDGLVEAGGLDEKKETERPSEKLLREAYAGLDLLMDFTPEGSLPKSVKKMLDGVGETKEEKAVKKKQGRDTDEKDTEESTIIVHVMEDLGSLLDFEVYGMINAGAKIRRCRNCGRYFVPAREKDEYCSRPIQATQATQATGKTCYDRGLFPVFEDQKELEAYLNAKYEGESNRRDALVRRGTMTREFLLAWREEAKHRKKLAIKGEFDPYEYCEWLKSS